MHLGPRRRTGSLSGVTRARWTCSGHGRATATTASTGDGGTEQKTGEDTPATYAKRKRDAGKDLWLTRGCLANLFGSGKITARRGRRRENRGRRRRRGEPGHARLCSWLAESQTMTGTMIALTARRITRALWRILEVAHGGTGRRCAKLWHRRWGNGCLRVLGARAAI